MNEKERSTQSNLVGKLENFPLNQVACLLLIELYSAGHVIKKAIDFGK